MTAFAQPFLFLRNPRSGIEDLRAMHAAGFRGVFCNVGDHSPTEWEAIIRPRALAAGMFCGPWARTAEGANEWSPGRLELLVYVAQRWASPLVVNTESEAKGSGSEITEQIVAACAGFDAAVSMEWRPFDDVYWVPLGDAGIPVLPQLFPEAGVVDAVAARDLWHSYGVRCVYPTFASYGGRRPSDYNLQAAYSIYTADDCGNDYASWAPTSSGWDACLDDGDGGGEEEITVEGKGAATSADAAFDYWYSSTATGPNWRAQNPGEWAAVQEYREAPAGTPPPTTIKSNTGKMLLELIEARRYAEGSHA